MSLIFLEGIVSINLAEDDDDDGGDDKVMGVIVVDAVCMAASAMVVMGTPHAAAVSAHAASIEGM